MLIQCCAWLCLYRRCVLSKVFVSELTWKLGVRLLPQCVLCTGKYGIYIETLVSEKKKTQKRHSTFTKMVNTPATGGTAWDGQCDIRLLLFTEKHMPQTFTRGLIYNVTTQTIVCVLPLLVGTQQPHASRGKLPKLFKARVFVLAPNSSRVHALIEKPLPNSFIWQGGGFFWPGAKWKIIFLAGCSYWSKGSVEYTAFLQQHYKPMPKKPKDTRMKWNYWDTNAASDIRAIFLNTNSATSDVKRNTHRDEVLQTTTSYKPTPKKLIATWLQSEVKFPHVQFWCWRQLATCIKDKGLQKIHGISK
jgi:hypothetical protein